MVPSLFCISKSLFCISKVFVWKCVWSLSLSLYLPPLFLSVVARHMSSDALYQMFSSWSILLFYIISFHSSYKIHQLFTDYLLRLPSSELLEKHLFRSRANRRLVLCGWWLLGKIFLLWCHHSYIMMHCVRPCHIIQSILSIHIKPSCSLSVTVIEPYFSQSAASRISPRVQWRYEPRPKTAAATFFVHGHRAGLVLLYVLWYCNVYNTHTHTPETKNSFGDFFFSIPKFPLWHC